MTTNALQVQLPVSAHLLKFMHTKFGNPIVLDNSHHMLIALKMFFTPTHSTLTLFNDTPREARIMPNTLHFLIVHDYYKPLVKLSSKGNWLINEYLDKIFADDLQQYIDRNWPKNKQHSRKALIEKYCDQHSIIIDEDITLDCLLKIDFRYRKYRSVKKHGPAVIAA